MMKRVQVLFAEEELEQVRKAAGEVPLSRWIKKAALAYRAREGFVSVVPETRKVVTEGKKPREYGEITVVDVPSHDGTMRKLAPFHTLPAVEQEIEYAVMRSSREHILRCDCLSCGTSRQRERERRGIK